MYNFKFSKSDIKVHIEKNKTIYLMLLLCLFLGIIIGIIISISKTSYLGLLNIKDKTMINIINGSVSLISNFWSYLFSFSWPFVLIFLFSLNYYLNFINFGLFAYQGSLLFLTSLAVVQSYGFSGFIKILFVILPINIAFFVLMMFWIVICTARVRISKKIKTFSAGFSDGFFASLYVLIFLVVLLSFVAGFIYPLILKSAIFLIF